ncbi:protein-associating with the carboxyl-terminal domain of ezrin-like [Homarus americanus]|uniref:Protein-associating with the carboxyl-terminal domain of ezrin-like n=1 Tax=Homarus americanus TaxID=6706 RepID=A0A8J5MWX8_HOMAM|nr:protein-associating with the carboxyl-terminal domain of ezrin-like [Homarus americanus]KAG7166372.1 Protein-associating with the carboxyl-terminal domain of ezrin-like [Homarus americanus]
MLCRSRPPSLLDGLLFDVNSSRREDCAALLPTHRYLIPLSGAPQAMGNADSTLGHLEVDRDKGEVYEDWMMAPGELEGVPVTVFSAAHPSSSRKRPYIERALQASRVYRHPGLLKYLDGGMIGGEVVVVTERAAPLMHHDLEQFSPLHISAGLLSIIDTLVFLHDRAGVSHNNVSTASIFVTPDGAWKLWGLEYSCSFGELTRDHIEHINSYCHEKFIPPDDKTRITPAYQHARDSYAFACLVEDVLSPETVSELAGAEDFLSLVQRCGLNKDWTQRPRLATLADHHIFSHDFLKLHDNLTNVLLLTDQKREEFLKSVADSLRQYPEELVSGTLAKALLSRPLLLHPAASTHLMPKVLIPNNGADSEAENGLFSQEVFQRNIVPQLVRLFGIHDATVRSILLMYLPYYVSLIPKDVLANEVLPELLLGIRDSSDSLVMSTLHALAELVPILGANTVIGENRQNLFTTAKPKAAASLPISKAASSHQLSSTEPKTTTSKVTKTRLAASAPPHPDEPPPPPPRTISLPPEPINTEVKSDVTSLDNLSIDSIVLTQIPERSSPDGGEDSGTLTNPSAGPSGPVGSDVDAWSSDWEEMQDAPLEDFSMAILAVNQDKDELKTSDDKWGMDVMNEEDTSFAFKSTNKMKVNAPPEAAASLLSSSKRNITEGSYSVNVKSSSGMKLTNVKNKDAPSSVVPKRTPSLGEEFDVLAIKVNKKHDVELDLFADLEPKFDTKKFDLESLLMEANCKVQGIQKVRSPSVSETLAGLDTSGAAEAWGTEEGWGEQINLFDVSPLNSETSSPSKSVNKGTEMNSLLMGVNINSLSDKNVTSSGRSELSAVSSFASQSYNNGVASTSEVKDSWDNGWGDF